VNNKFKRPTLPIVFLALAGLGFLQGCKPNVPLPSSILATPLNSNVVSNFKNASLKVNPTLIDSSQGVFLDGSYAYLTDSMGLTTPLASATNPDPSGSPYAMHLFGTYLDYGNGGYPAFELECFPRGGGGYYDASSFTGIQFDWCTGPNDNSNQRFFCLVTARIAPQSIGGTGACGTGSNVPCYDFLGASLFGTGGNWFALNIDFASMQTQYSSGSASQTVTPTDLTQVLQLMWTNRSNNVGSPGGTPYTCDMWLDDIEFY
jgi:hypothetical protein